MWQRLGSWWRKQQKRRVLRQYIRQLGPALANDYGREQSYSVGRIRAALRKLELPTSFEQHALAMFATRRDFSEAMRTTEGGDAIASLYDELRLEAAELANGGRHRFMPKHWEDIGMDNGDNASAASRWGRG